MTKSKFSKQSESLKGEISGAFLLGLTTSFPDTNIFMESELPFEISELNPNAWYPYSHLIDTIKQIESNVAISDSLLFQAGINFLRFWYEQGPGKEMIFSSYDWLHAQDEGGGYNSVARGGTPEEIGWTRTLTSDGEAGVVVIENVMPIMGEYLKGVYYGGCLIFDDLAYVDVSLETQPFPGNNNFHRSLITIHYRLKSNEALEKKISKLSYNEEIILNNEEIQELAWILKGVLYRNALEMQYKEDITSLLAAAFSKSREMEISLQKALKSAESFNKMAVGRELKMIELKKEINELAARLGEEKRYD